jgi:hypothetical protein
MEERLLVSPVSLKHRPPLVEGNSCCAIDNLMNKPNRRSSICSASEELSLLFSSDYGSSLSGGSALKGGSGIDCEVMDSKPTIPARGSSESLQDPRLSNCPNGYCTSVAVTLSCTTASSTLSAKDNEDSTGVPGAAGEDQPYFFGNESISEVLADFLRTRAVELD